MSLKFIQIIKSGVWVHPFLTRDLEIWRSFQNEFSLEQPIVNAQIFLTFPFKLEIWAGDLIDADVVLVTDDDKLLNCWFYKVFINHFVISVFFDFLLNR